MVDFAFALEADGEDSGVFLEEDGAYGGDLEVACSQGVDYVVGLVIGDAEIADDVVLAASAAEEVEGGGEAGLGGDFAAALARNFAK